MNTFQKVIKYLAIAFAIFLTIGILTGIVSIVSGVFGVFSWEEENRMDFSMDYSGIEQLDIKHKVGTLNIKNGSGFRVEATNVTDDFKAEVVNKTLVIEEPDSMRKFLGLDFGISNKKSIITVYVPEEFIADRIKIESGVGEVNIENLSTERLIIKAGVGDLYGKSITAKRVDADGGVGNMKLVDVKFTDVDFDSGVGNVDIEGVILGKSDFSCGVGSVNVRIQGAREDYAIRVDTGLGRVSVNGNKVSRDYNDTNRADNSIRISGGIGDVDIEFMQ